MYTAIDTKCASTGRALLRMLYTIQIIGWKSMVINDRRWCVSKREILIRYLVYQPLFEHLFRETLERWK